MTRLAAVILAGGQGTRLGGTIKGNVVVGGVRLLERVSTSLGAAPSQVLVAHGAFAPEEIGLLPSQIPVADIAADYRGPIAGLAAAVAWCGGEDEAPDALLTVAVDTPFLPQDLASRMLAALGPADSAIIASHAGQAYPTNAIWRLAAIADLPDRIRAGTAPRSLKRLADEVGGRTLDWPESDGGDPFANANTPADLAALEARARRGN